MVKRQRFKSAVDGIDKMVDGIDKMVDGIDKMVDGLGEHDCERISKAVNTCTKLM